MLQLKTFSDNIYRTTKESVYKFSNFWQILTDFRRISFKSSQYSCQKKKRDYTNFFCPNSHIFSKTPDAMDALSLQVSPTLAVLAFFPIVTQ